MFMCPHRCVNVTYVVLVLVLAAHLAQAGPFEVVRSNNLVTVRNSSCTTVCHSVQGGVYTPIRQAP